MESIICHSTMKFHLEHEIIPAEQHGFMPNQSVVTKLLSFLNDRTGPENLTTIINRFDKVRRVAYYTNLIILESKVDYFSG